MKRKHTSTPLFDDPRVVALLLPLAAGSGFYTYRGAAMVIQAGAVDWMSQSGAVIFSIVSSTAIFLLWTTMPRAFAKLETVGEWLVGMCITIVVCVMIFSLSSWLNVAGIAGQAALVNHMERLIVQYEDVLDRRYAAALAIEAFRPDLQQAKTLYLARRDAERHGGAYTGRPGPGTVERLLETLSQRFGESDKAVAVELVRLKDVAQKARHKLAPMRAVVNQPGDPNVRMENLAREADRLRALLGELSARGFIAGLQRRLQAMPREIALQSITAKTKQGKEDQKAALQRIHVELTDTLDQLRADLEPLATSSLPVIPAVTRLNAIEAVLRYPLQNAPYWAGGIAMDFTPTIILLLGMLMKAARGRRGLFVDTLDNTTVKEIKIAQHAEEVIRQKQISQESLERLHDETTGARLLTDESDDDSV